MTSDSSRKCLVCNRMVRFKSPTFPYCNYHVGIKYSKSNLLTYADPETMAKVREHIYNPERSIVKRHMDNVLVMSEGSHVNIRAISNTYKQWSMSTKGMNIFSAREAYHNRDQILDSINDVLSKDYDVQYLDCDGGTILIPNEGLKHTDNHKIIYAENDADSFIVDGATAAPLHNIINKDIDEIFNSGTSTCGDGLFISSLFEYGRYGSVLYNKISSSKNGELFWHNPNILHDSEVESQRRLKEQYGYDESIAAKPTYLSSATDWLKQSNNDKQEERIMKEYKEPESIEDILGFD